MNGGFYKSIIDDEAFSKAEIPLQRLYNQSHSFDNISHHSNKCRSPQNASAKQSDPKVL
jgi:hypothetical protein